jgi:hypothetical protein
VRDTEILMLLKGPIPENVLEGGHMAIDRVTSENSKQITYPLVLANISFHVSRNYWVLPSVIF